MADADAPLSHGIGAMPEDVVVALVAPRARSFDELYREEFPQLARLAYTMCGRRAEAEEFAQEALAKAFANWATVSTMDKPGAWCRRVLLNEVIGRSRRNATDRRRRGLFAVKEQTPDVAVLGATVEALWAQVRMLPNRQAQVVSLIYGLDLPATEVAEILGIDAASVRSHLFAAKRTLAERLGDEWKGLA